MFPKRRTNSRELYQLCGRDSSVRTVTGYGLDGPGIESRRGRDFPHLSSPALGPTQLPVQWVPSLSRGKERPGRDADPSPTSSAVFKKEYSYTSHSSYRPYGLYIISVPVQVYTLHINCGGKGTYGIVQDSLLREAFQHTHTHIHTSCRGLRWDIVTTSQKCLWTSVSSVTSSHYKCWRQTCCSWVCSGLGRKKWDKHLLKSFWLAVLSFHEFCPFFSLYIQSFSTALTHPLVGVHYKVKKKQENLARISRLTVRLWFNISD